MYLLDFLGDTCGSVSSVGLGISLPLHSGVWVESVKSLLVSEGVLSLSWEFGVDNGLSHFLLGMFRAWGVTVCTSLELMIPEMSALVRRGLRSW